MKKVLLPIITLLLIFSNDLFAQRNCSTMEYLEQQLQQDPGLAPRMEQIEHRTQRFIRERGGARNFPVITIPVVVHVVWNTAAENISDAQIQSQIDVLNEDFRRLNLDADDVWPQASDSYVEFCLAIVAPDGSPTNGINRRQTAATSFNSGNQMKFNLSGGIDAWPSDQYMNFWVCDLSGGLLGYAQFPGGDPRTDGIVVDYAYFGRFGSALPPFNLGRTATHEVGHWLNLRHIWGDGGCGFDDFVADTPLSDAANGGCNIGHISCGSVDMVQNYMDYSDDACMNLFTAGQADRMQALFAPGGARFALTQSTACGVLPTCDDGIQNGDETGVDCGGTFCPPCETEPTCDDGIQNGDETGIDCGGSSCPPCEPVATCDDGVQNGDETGVDCGGSICPPCETPICEAPTNLTSSTVPRGRNTMAFLGWTAGIGATSYTVEIRLARTNNWTSQSANGTSLIVFGLITGADYEWRVTSNCGGGLAETSEIATFIAGQGSRLASSGLTVYPNPTSLLLTVDLAALELEESVADQDLHLLVYDLTGKLVHRSVVDHEQFITQLDVSRLAQGLYLLKVQDAAGRPLDVTRFVVER